MILTGDLFLGSQSHLRKTAVGKTKDIKCKRTRNKNLNRFCIQIKDFVLTIFLAEKSVSGSQQQHFCKSTVKQDATACFLFRNSKSASIGF